MGLEVKGVSKYYGEKKVVNDLSFNVLKPGVFGLLGTNGAGKTTTIRMILNVITKDGGQILWNGCEISKQKLLFGYLPEERGLYPKVKVSEQLMYFARLRGVSKDTAKDNIKYWLGRLDASQYENMNAEKLSKGNQQKIQLIAALIHDPELIFLDEPFSGLDPVNTDLFKSVVYELIEKNRYIIMSSHQMNAVEEFCRDIVLLKAGNAILNGNLRDIKASYGRSNLEVKCQGEIEKFAQELGIKKITQSAAGYEFKISDEKQGYSLLQKILDAGLPLDKFEIREPSLHEIFIEKVGTYNEEDIAERVETK